MAATRHQTIVVSGLTELLVATSYAEKSVKKIVRDRLRESGKIVQAEAASMFRRYDPKTAAGFRTVVRMRGVSVEQRLRKTTGLRPDFGSLQMRRALVPALEKKSREVEANLQHGLDELSGMVNHA